MPTLIEPSAREIRFGAPNLSAQAKVRGVSSRIGSLRGLALRQAGSRQVAFDACAGVVPAHMLSAHHACLLVKRR